MRALHGSRVLPTPACPERLQPARGDGDDHNLPGIPVRSRRVPCRGTVQPTTLAPLFTDLTDTHLQEGHAVLKLPRLDLYDKFRGTVSHPVTQPVPAEARCPALPLCCNRSVAISHTDRTALSRPLNKRHANNQKGGNEAAARSGRHPQGKPDASRRREARYPPAQSTCFARTGLRQAARLWRGCRGARGSLAASRQPRRTNRMILLRCLRAGLQRAATALPAREHPHPAAPQRSRGCPGCAQHRSRCPRTPRSPRRGAALPAGSVPTCHRDRRCSQLRALPCAPQRGITVKAASMASAAAPAHLEPGPWPGEPPASWPPNRGAQERNPSSAAPLAIAGKSRGVPGGTRRSSSPWGSGQQHPAGTLASNAGGEGKRLWKGHHHPLHRRERRRVPTQSHGHGETASAPASPTAALPEGTGTSAPGNPPAQGRAQPDPTAPTAAPSEGCPSSPTARDGAVSGAGGSERGHVPRGEPELPGAAAGTPIPTPHEGWCPQGAQAPPSPAALQLFQHLRDGCHRRGCPRSPSSVSARHPLPLVPLAQRRDAAFSCPPYLCGETSRTGAGHTSGRWKTNPFPDVLDVLSGTVPIPPGNHGHARPPTERSPSALHHGTKCFLEPPRPADSADSHPHARPWQTLRPRGGKSPAAGWALTGAAQASRG